MGVPRPGDLKKIQDAGLKAGWDSLPIHCHHFSPGMEFRIPGTHAEHDAQFNPQML
jgi:hypothetical protein